MTRPATQHGRTLPREAADFFAPVIADLVDRHGLDRLADMLEISRDGITKWKKGESAPSLGALRDLAVEFDEVFQAFLVWVGRAELAELDKMDRMAASMAAAVAAFKAKVRHNDGEAGRRSRTGAPHGGKRHARAADPAR